MTHAADRLAALRTRLVEAGVEGLLIPRSDEYLGEYVPASGDRLAWLTGFTGSAGIAIVLADAAVIFTDGRYTTQVAAETDPVLWERQHLTEAPPQDWLRAHATGLRIGYDPWLHPEAALTRFRGSGAVLVPLSPNPLDLAWVDRPASPAAAVEVHPIRFAGREAAAKREEAARVLRAAGQAAVVLADPHSVAWLLNIRGRDLPHTPLALGFALLRDDASVTLFLDPARIGAETAAHLGNAVSVAPRSELGAALDALAGQSVRVDADTTPAWFAARLRAAGAQVVAGEDPCRLPRAIKNTVEQAGSRSAHHRDAAALARFLHWFAGAAPGGGQTEMSAAARLLEERGKEALFVAESFPAIAGAGEHGAVIHYRATPETNRAIHPGEVFLLDSGGQYRDGTTDVTRTLWTGPGPAPAGVRDHATRVLRGHVALASLNFPKGVAGPHLDAIARRPLWDAGLDYDHGTGHGVGSFLSVHEGPAAFSRAARIVPLEPGMILSDEPGFYVPGHYGIRIENLLLVAPATPRFLAFETLTLAPYDRALIEVGMLTEAERAWVDAYHARVAAEVAPLLEGAVRDWLLEACRPL
ncbi:Xaa-Pro aminopeptidase [Humitalea rosea]|uniref:Xaa-Pro aminopeptidase n=1 Tax=Humitalea rosea TaxID=990373 RepID=A0A2W7IKC1_9PROT|nr:aminopeptidase P family protein [Humitalea rosea]PZW45677.1 Xaa-Pro aminopeptidase [Humitalea rosea]